MTNRDDDGWEALPSESETLTPPPGFLPGATMPGGGRGTMAASAPTHTELMEASPDRSSIVTGAFDPETLTSLEPGEGGRQGRKSVRVVPIPDAKMRLLPKPTRPAGFVLPPLVLVVGLGFACWLWLVLGSAPMAVLTAATAAVGAAMCWVMLRD